MDAQEQHIYNRSDPRLEKQWETALQRNVVSHWLGANLESALYTCTLTAIPREGIHAIYFVNSWEIHDDVIKRKHFPCYWPFVKGIDQSPVDSPRKGQWRGALMFPLICARTNGWANNRDAGDFIRHGTHYDVTVMETVNCRKFFVLPEFKMLHVSIQMLIPYIEK